MKTLFTEEQRCDLELLSEGESWKRIASPKPPGFYYERRTPKGTATLAKDGKDWFVTLGKEKVKLKAKGSFNHAEAAVQMILDKKVPRAAAPRKKTKAKAAGKEFSRKAIMDAANAAGKAAFEELYGSSSAQSFPGGVHGHAAALAQVVKALRPVLVAVGRVYAAKG